MTRAPTGHIMNKPELAVLGGSFDPPHIGHVFLATYALSVSGVQRVLVAPTFQHAFAKPLRAFDVRLELCQLAFAPLVGCEVSPIERELGGTSRTLRLVQELSTRFPGHQLRLLVGADILGERQRWHAFDEIIAIAPLLVAERGGYQSQGDGPVLPQVSSSDIRTRLQNGGDVSHWLPAAVRRQIDERRLYRADEG